MRTRSIAFISALSLMTGGGVFPERALAQRVTTAMTPDKEGTRIVLDFSGTGVRVGAFNNLAFSVSPSNPAATMVVPRFDYADCTKGQESLLLRSVSQLGEGQPVWIDYIDVELVPLTQSDISWTAGVCYGVRSRGQSWNWHFATVPLRFDTQAKTVVGRILIKSGPFDAVKLVFEYALPPHSVQQISVVTIPQVPMARPR